MYCNIIINNKKTAAAATTTTVIIIVPASHQWCMPFKTRSVAFGFGRHGMPPPASNDTCTALGQDGSYWSRNLATLTFDLAGHGACGWCGSSSSIRIPILKFVGLAGRKIWHTMCVSINGPGDLDLWPFDLESGMWVASTVGNLPSKLGTLSLWVICYVRDGRTDGQTDGQKQC